MHATPLPDATATALFLGCAWTAVALLFAFRFLRRAGTLGRASAVFRRLPSPVRFAAVLAAGALVLYGGTKPGADPLGMLLQGAEQLFEYLAGSESQGAPEAPAEPSLSESQWLAGFALSAAATNEAFDLSAPSNATVYAAWRLRGASEDGFWCQPSGWTFPLGTGSVSAAYASSSGTLSFGRRKSSPVPAALPDGSGIDFLAPLQTLLGVAPEANWHLLSATNSLFWHDTTDAGSARFTWRNVLLGRASDAPVSFQAELFPSGDFAFRYDLSALPPGAWPPTNAPAAGFAVGAQRNGGGETALLAVGAQFCAPSNHVCAALWLPGTPDPVAAPLCEALAGAPRFSLRWTSLRGLDPGVPDPDGDGLPAADEVLLHHTDPRLADTDWDGVPDGTEIAAGSDPTARDTDGDGLVDGSDPDPLVPTSLDDLDGDGIPDAYETHWFGSTNAVDSLAHDPGGTGFPLSTKIAAGMRPDAAAATASLLSANLASLKLSDGFQCDFAAATNLVFRRTVALDRAGGWQQYFLSSNPSGPAGWTLDGMVLEWTDSDGTNGTATASPPGDSLRLPVSTGNPATLTLTLRATAAAVLCPQPLYLLAWAPEVQVSGAVHATTNGTPYHAVVRVAEDTAADLAFGFSNRPCRAEPTAGELSARDGLFAAEPRLVFTPSGGGTGGTLTAKAPGVYPLPSAGLAGLGPSAGVLLFLDPRLTYGDGHSGGCGTPLLFDPADGTYSAADAYPLDSACLRRNWLRDAMGAYACGCEPELDYGASGLDEILAASIQSDDRHATATVTLGGTFVWSGEAWHHLEGGCADPDECDDCATGCADGNCDDLEGDQAGSLAFRIPLGMPRAAQVSGFLWFRTEGPASVSPGLFNLLARADSATTDTTAGGTRTVACSDFRGRTAAVTNIAGGVCVTLTRTADATLEHTWEITNVGGPSSIRLRKVSRLGNTMSDRTYEYRTDGASPPSWTRADNIAQASEQVVREDGLDDPADGILREDRILREAAGTVLSRTVTESRRFGFGADAVLRETYRASLAATGWNEETTSCWTDPDHPRRNGKPRLRSGNAGAWSYRTWDDEGRELFRLEPFDGSAAPVGIDDGTPRTLEDLPASLTALATVSAYAPLPGDSNHRDDIDAVRTESRYVVLDGAPMLVGRTWRVYLHGTNAAGQATVTLRTVLAGSQTTAQGDPANAVTETTAYAADAPGIPLLLRGQPISSIGADGVATRYAYDLGTYDPATHAFAPGGAETHLRTAVTTSTAAAPDGLPGQSTVSVVVRDAVHGTEAWSATHALLPGAPGGTLSPPFDWQARAYDDKNRIRSTLHSDGSATTNAYSCCRLLWSAGRDGARVLRSANTGTDHLYYAEEDVWLDELTRDHPSYYALARHIKVTQHFMDALGRETNTVVRTSNTEGEAVDPGFVSYNPPRFTETTSYPDGTSGHVIRTDRRGFRTVSRRTSFADRGESVEQTFHPTNLVTPILASTNVWYHNGGSIAVRHWDGQWTRETRWTDYSADGCRRTFSAIEASDIEGVLTNAVTVSDFLSRTVATVGPGAGGSLLTTSNTYAGASSRLVRTATTGSPSTEYLYDALGNRAGTLRDGIADISETRYETVSNILWRVSSQWRAAGGVTNAPSIVREQLTGLSDTLRRHTVSTSPDGRTTVSTESFDPATKTTTATTQTDGATPSVVKTKYGAVVETRDPSARTLYYHDAFLTPGHHVRVFHPVTDALLARRYIWEIDDDTWDPLQTRTYYGTGDGTVVDEFASYDSFGRVTATTNALGHATSSAYDTQGRALAAWGATYPVAHEYDTAGRRTSLSTTRDSSADFGALASHLVSGQSLSSFGSLDTTQWLYDPATGLVTNKVYADGSAVATTHTPDGKPLRTTWARGAWREHSYTASGLLAGIEYGQAPVPGPATPAVSLAYDAFRRIATASNAVAAYAYANSALGVATNETAVLGGDAFTLTRKVDNRHRLSALSVDGSLHAAYSYDTENRLAAVSNNVFAVAYSYASDALDAGYTVTMTNGTILSRTVLRDPYRRHLVTSITNRVDSTAVSSYRYAHDLLDRATSRVDGGTVTNAFGYNPRSEVSSATIATNVYVYAYDPIGNRLAATNNALATLYACDPLNQYTNIVEGVAPSTPHYDSDGNLLTNGVWSYTWDAENRLVAAYSNALCVVSNAYDHASRRVLKVTPSATRTFVYDGWNLVQERITVDGSLFTTNSYFWGKDLSGSLQGAGGIGGLLAVCMDGTFFFPFFDHNGNVTAYVDAQGTVVASYTYDAFGNTIAQTGSMADAFPHRFSTKYFDADTGLYYYGYRFYSPELGRWLNRDPIGEQGGENLHGFVGNDGVDGFDNLGLKIEYTRKGESQVDVTCDCDESIATLAEHFHLAPDEVNSWLEVADGGGLPSDPEEKFDRERRFKVVNEVHVTQGDSGQRANVLPFLMKRKDVMIAHYREMKYKVVDDTPGDVTGENIDQILANLDSKHIYIWVHLGHGTTTYGNLALNDREPYNPLPLPLDHAPSSFTARHKLGEVVLFACAAGTKSADWKAQLVGPGGDLWATPDLIYVGTGLGWIGRPWNHKLRKY